MNEKKAKKKGWFDIIWESMTKTGGCCGPGESCCGPSLDKKEEEKPQKEEEEKSCCDFSGECG
jgi:hypothetical protein